MHIALHVLRIGLVALVLAALMLLPFMPGQYDGLAQTLSTWAQLIGIFGLVLVPIGVSWFAYEIRKRDRLMRNLPQTDKRYRFALTAFVAASALVLLIALATFVVERLATSILLLALWLCMLRLVWPALRRVREAESVRFSTAPLYLIIVPLAVLVVQLVLAAPATEYSRARAMAASTSMIEEIERYRTAHGHYPESMLGINKDYHPAIVGIDRYHYARRGAGYNLAFEQPRFLLDEFGAREFVVYNSRDEHVILSHASWNALWPPDAAATRQGWFAVHETGVPHWKYFWFD